MSCTGAVIAYKMSQIFLRDLIFSLAPEKISKFRSEIQRHRHHLVPYLIAIRIPPIAPHWLYNMASPIIKVPLRYFTLGEPIGWQWVPEITRNELRIRS